MLMLSWRIKEYIDSRVFWGGGKKEVGGKKLIGKGLVVDQNNDG